MLYSMTGFGKGIGIGVCGNVTVEIKSVNSKALDLNIKLPRELFPFEDVIKNIISKRVARGKVDVYVQFAPSTKMAPTVEVNFEIAKAYIDAEKKAAELFDIPDRLSNIDLFKIPDVFVVKTPEADPEVLKETVSNGCNEAVDNLLKMRACEGANLEAVLKDILNNIKGAFEIITERAPFITKEYQEKLRDRINQLLGGENTIDEQRLAQEVAIFADKSNIDEEMARIKSHLGQLDVLIEGGIPVGRELEFIVQEFKREINTLGCKSNDTVLFNNVLIIKGELEKFREQIQNIE